MNDRATELTVGASRSSTVSNNCYKKKGISKGNLKRCIWNPWNPTTLHSGKTSLAEKKGFAQNKGKKTPHNEKKNSSQQNDKLRANRKKREYQKVYMKPTLTTLHSGKTSLAEKKGFAQNKGKKTPHYEKKKNSSQQNDKLRASTEKKRLLLHLP